MQEHRTPAAKLFYTVAQTLRDSVEQSSVSGLVLEFGVRFGTTVKLLQQYSKQTVHGFDSFQGLPTSWHEVPQGAYSTNPGLCFSEVGEASQGTAMQTHAAGRSCNFTVSKRLNEQLTHIQ